MACAVYYAGGFDYGCGFRNVSVVPLQIGKIKPDSDDFWR
jgi:hypothetical protein